MTTLTLDVTKKLDITKYTDEQLKVVLTKMETTHSKQWTYFQFIAICRIYLEIESRIKHIDK